ncbi:MAG: serine/threonine-protein kinase [bacterium]
MTHKGRDCIGDYELIELVGTGPQGQVYRAQLSPRAGQADAHNPVVALKILTCAGMDQAAAARLERSAGILRTLSHPNIVRYVDSFTLHREWDDACCIVTEHLTGETLEVKLLKNACGLPWKTARHIFEQCIEGAIHARGHGIIHRDLKPSNIFVLNDGTAKLIDFDIARWDDATSTGSRRRLGSFDYMAPDFAREDGFQGDELSDIFSLGVAFYQALTGGLPYKKFGPAADAEYLHRWRTGREPALSFLPPVFRVLDSQAVEFFRLAIEPDRSKRFQTFAEMLAAIRNIRCKTVTGKDTYELEELLGHGGFGEVFRATGVRDGRPVAVKRLFEDMQSRRFIKEARLLQRLHHEHLVEYIDFVDVTGAAATHHFFLVMEMLPGMPGWTLRTRINNSPGGLGLMECLELFSHYLECLQYLHSHKIVHRDIKPANLYAPDGNPCGAKVFDLGIARDVTGTATTGFVPGTLEYMPPELGRGGGERGSTRTDIYSTGLSLYEALTGRPAFKRLPRDEREAFKQFLSRSESSGEKVDLSLPLFASHPALASIIAKAIDARPASRYASAAEMRRDIDTLMSQLRQADEKSTMEPAIHRADTAATMAPDAGTSASQETLSQQGAKESAPLRKHLLSGCITAAVVIAAVAAGLWLVAQLVIPGTMTRLPAKSNLWTTPATAPVATTLQAVAASPAPPVSPPATGAVSIVVGNSAAELSILVHAIEGETWALLESFSLSMAEYVALEHRRAESIAAKLAETPARPPADDSQRLRVAMDGLIMAATNQVLLLSTGDDAAALRDWPRLAPTLVSIPAVKHTLDRATVSAEATIADRSWLELTVRLETTIADLTAAAADAQVLRVREDFSAMEQEAGGNTGRISQVAYMAKRISDRFGMVAGELCGSASKEYARNNVKDGDVFRNRADVLKNLIPDRFGKTAVERIVTRCASERERALARLDVAEAKQKEAAALAAQRRARGSRLQPVIMTEVPPVKVMYRGGDTGRWAVVMAGNAPVYLQPGTYSFRFTRPDYETVEAAVDLTPGAEALTVPVPGKWTETSRLVTLLNTGTAMASDHPDIAALDAVFDAPSPAFEWSDHATRFQVLRKQWSQLRRELVVAALNSADRAVAGYVRWLYQVHDPATGTYRRHKTPMPVVAFKLPPPDSTNAPASDESAARFKRLKAWQTAAGSFLGDTGQSDLAAILSAYAAEMATVSTQQSARCRFEAAVLLSKPGTPDAALEKLQAPDEVACWRAHAGYSPRTSSIETLRNLAVYAGSNAVTNDFDLRLGLFSAFYTWRNAVAGERQYAMEVNTALGTILSRLDAGTSADVISYLGAAALRDSQNGQEDDPGLFMIKAMTFMPGLAHGSDLKRQAAAWLANHGSDPVVARKEAAMRDALDLLQSLLKPE